MIQIDIDLTGGQSEFRAWDKHGNLAIYMATPGRPAPVTPAVSTGTLALVATPTETTITGTLDDSQTKLLTTNNSYSYQWDYFNSSNSHSRALSGEIRTRGRAMS